MSVASLPMYDLPALHDETDRLWAAIRAAFEARGIDAPEQLDRERGIAEVWTDPDLLLSQTCGRPYRLGLHENVTLLGAPDYGVEGCPPGFYRSALVVRAGDAREALIAFDGARCAFNATDSQSGYAALLSAIEPFEKGPHFFAAWHETGGHAMSIEAVADDKADLAAIDAVTWRLARRHQPAARKLRVLGWTAPTPGLPYITAKTRDPLHMAEAIEDGIEALDTSVRSALGIEGFVRLSAGDYLGTWQDAAGHSDTAGRRRHP